MLAPSYAYVVTFFSSSLTSIFDVIISSEHLDMGLLISLDMVVPGTPGFDLRTYHKGLWHCYELNLASHDWPMQPLYA